MITHTKITRIRHQLFLKIIKTKFSRTKSVITQPLLPMNYNSIYSAVFSTTTKNMCALVHAPNLFNSTFQHMDSAQRYIIITKKWCATNTKRNGTTSTTRILRNIHGRRQKISAGQASYNDISFSEGSKL